MRDSLEISHNLGLRARVVDILTNLGVKTPDPPGRTRNAETLREMKTRIELRSEREGRSAP